MSQGKNDGQDSISPNEMFEKFALNSPVVNKDNYLKQQKKKKNNSYNRVDLHGYTLNSAISRIEGELNRSNSRKIRFITGKGKHSSGIYSVLNRGIEDYLESRQSGTKIHYRKVDGGFEIWQEK